MECYALEKLSLYPTDMETFRLFSKMNPPTWMVELMLKYPYDETFIDEEYHSSNTQEKIISTKELDVIQNDNFKVFQIRPRIVYMNGVCSFDMEYVLIDDHITNDNAWNSPDSKVIFVSISSPSEYEQLPEELKIGTGDD